MKMLLRSRNVLPLGLIVLSLICRPAGAQWLKVPARAIPRTSDGKPNLAAPAPRLADGRPDLSGIWEPRGRYVQNLAADLKPEEVPFQAWAKALFDERKNGSYSREDPTAQCLPAGVPRINAAPPPWKLIQTPGFIVIIYEASTLWRQIFLDGRELAQLPRFSAPFPGNRRQVFSHECEF